MDVKRVKISEIHEDPANSRKHGERNLATITASLTQFGQVEPLVVQKSTGRVVGGNGRLAAMRKMGLQEVDIVEVDLTDVQAASLGIALNRTAELAEWDLEALARTVSGIKEDVDLASLGWDPNELEQLLGVAGNKLLTDPDAVPEILPTAVSQPGDLWRLGDHVVLCGDSTDPKALERLLEGRKADMAFTDPPWNVAIGLDSNPRHRQRPGLANDDLSQADFSGFLTALATQLFTHCVGDVYCVMGCQQWPAIDLALRQAGFHWSATVIWAKDLFVLGRSNYHRQYEPIWYGWPEGSASTFRGGRDQSDLWEIPRPRRSEEHPTMKPVALVNRAIGNSSGPGATVLDPFLGSGTTLIACEELGRRCVGLELEPRYVDVIVKRWAQATRKQPRLEREGKEVLWETVSAGFATAAGAGGASSASEALTTPKTSVATVESLRA